MSLIEALPNPLYRWIKSLKIKKRLRSLRNRLQGGARPLSKAALVRDLRALGVREGDVLLVHSSLSRLGLIEGGPTTVVDALLAAVGKTGTVAVSTIHLKVQAADHFAENPRFDVSESPCTVGAISETLRKRPDSQRSLHPTHSVAAIGPQAEFLLTEHHTDARPFGPASPYYRLGEVHGKVLLLGIGLPSMTNFHVVEDRMGDAFPYPVYLPEIVQARVLDAAGKERVVPTRIHNPAMSRLRQCDLLEPELERRGVVRIGKVGHGRTLVVDATGLDPTLQELAGRGITIYTPDGQPLDL